VKIGYLIPEFPSQTHAFFWREMAAVKKLGNDVVIFSTRKPKNICKHSFAQEAISATNYLYPPKVGALGITLHPVYLFRMLLYIASVKGETIKNKLRLLLLVPLAYQLHKEIQSQNVTHMHGHSCADAAHLLALCCSHGKTTYSLTLHGDLEVYGTGHIAKFRAAKFVAVVTRPLQQQVHDTCGLEIAKIPIITMGVNTDVFHPVANKQRDSSSFNMVTVARLAQCKGHTYALRALRQVIDRGYKIKYSIIGEGDYRDHIAAEIKNLGLDEYVKLIGSASEEEISKCLRESDLFVLSSVGKGEAAPVSVMEAMSSGIAVIVSIIGGTADMIKNEVDGILVPQGDHGAIAQSIMKIIDDPIFYQQLCTNARNKSLRMFSYEQEAAKLFTEIAR